MSVKTRRTELPGDNSFEWVEKALAAAVGSAAASGYEVVFGKLVQMPPTGSLCYSTRS